MEVTYSCFCIVCSPPRGGRDTTTFNKVIILSVFPREAEGENGKNLIYRLKRRIDIIKGRDDKICQTKN